MRSPLGPDPGEAAAADPRQVAGRGDDGRRFKRGRLIHRLLQTLPDLPAAAREEAGRRYLARPLHDLGGAEAEEILSRNARRLGRAGLGAAVRP